MHHTNDINLFIFAIYQFKILIYFSIFYFEKFIYFNVIFSFTVLILTLSSPYFSTYSCQVNPMFVIDPVL